MRKRRTFEHRPGRVRDPHTFNPTGALVERGGDRLQAPLEIRPIRGDRLLVADDQRARRGRRLLPGQADTFVGSNSGEQPRERRDAALRIRLEHLGRLLEPVNEQSVDGGVVEVLVAAVACRQAGRGVVELAEQGRDEATGLGVRLVLTWRVLATISGFSSRSDSRTFCG